MSASTGTTVQPEERRASPVIWQSTIIAGEVAILGSIIANLVVRYIGRLIFDVPAAFDPLASAQPVIVMTVIYTLGAMVAFTLLRYFGDRPWRTFLIIAAVVFVLSFLPMLTLIGQDGTTAAGIGILVAMHIATLIIVVGSLYRLAGRETRVVRRL
jgi:predicted ferric reductase